MDESNPFEAPKSVLTAPIDLKRKAILVKVARAFMKYRDKGGPTYWDYLRAQWARHILGLCSLGGLVVLMMMSTEFAKPLGYVIAAVVGAIFRDHAWLRVSSRFWYVTELFNDWDKVAEVAAMDPKELP